ncbi:Putative catalase core domain, catalase, mono-functional, hem-containing, Catalase superfamily [Septoria linicola]|uniref:Catalase core domain, catalase, mono-functional, hem-containing, Catalase superfamily n=1 Tax=Septoria linicola TaxID=215465 RepID=A0A9Q9EEE5_9PEZI|nr:putative catalase core domain, catalase, mono-functional, hem-containing, Catalase superfamily [Septoria linicola]USW46829.1 Putative catalase core domain, catalase, mono-functional, hem-containing, Catalase superfamily [Septoria linicola]
MPLTDDPKTLDTANALVSTLRGAFGTPDAYRPAHAKGHLVRGAFTPTPEAASLSKAPHFNNPSTPILARFSNSTGLPLIPDTSSDASPRGLAIRFLLSEDEHKHTDIITHSTPYFPVSSGEGFLALLQAIGNGTIGAFLQDNPAAAAFVQASKPQPVSFATERYFGVNAFKFVNANGEGKFVRYRVVPEEYNVLSKEDLDGKRDSYLFDELEERLKSGSGSFKLAAQVAEDGDMTSDATVRWPEERELVVLGTLALDAYEQEDKSLEEQQRIIFDPVPRIDGVEPSDDPLLDMRAAMYLISGRIRREAKSAA